MHQASLYECADGEWIHAATMNGLTPTRTPEEILGPGTGRTRTRCTRDPELRRAPRGPAPRRLRVPRTGEELVEAFHEARLGAEAVTPMADVFSHPQFVANGMAATVEDPELGSTTQVGVPAVLSGTPGGIQGGQPRVGEHSREVLGRVPATPRREIDGMVEAGVVEEDSSWAR